MSVDDLPPGPRYPSVMQAVGMWTRPLGCLRRCAARYGPTFTVRLPLTPPFVMVSTADDVRAVLTDPPDVLHPGAGRAGGALS